MKMSKEHSWKNTDGENRSPPSEACPVVTLPSHQKYGPGSSTTLHHDGMAAT
jgi:hypothetical protein